MRARSLTLVAVLVLTGGGALAPAEAPKPGPEPRFEPPRATRTRLANGMALLVIENHRLPLVSLALVVPSAGASADPPGKAGLAAYTADLLDEGAGGLSALAIAETAARLGASLDISTGADASLVVASTIGRTLEPTLDLFAAVVTRPSFDEAEARRVHTDRVTELRLRRDRPRELADVLLQGALFGVASPYGHPIDGNTAELAALGVADARAFYRRAWDPAQMTLVVAGDVKPAELKALLDARLSGWKRTGKKPPKPASARPVKPTARLLLVDRPGAEQTDVRFGLAGPLRSDARVYAWEVLVNVFGGGFTGRLTQRLREQLGVLYHVYPDLVYRPGGSLYAVTAPLFSPRTGEGMREILAMIASLATVDVPEAELRKSKQNLTRALPGLFESNRGIVLAYADLVRAGLPDDWYTRYARGIEAVTAKQVRGVAAKLLAGKGLVFVAVGDLATVRAELEKLELGAPKLFDLDGAPLP